MRILLKAGQQPRLAHHLNKARHENLATAFTLEVVVGFKNEDFDTLVGQQKRKNHPRRPGADNTDIYPVNFFRHNTTIVSTTGRFVKQ